MSARLVIREGLLLAGSMVPALSPVIRYVDRFESEGRFAAIESRAEKLEKGRLR